jgi:hypothetical protein
MSRQQGTRQNVHSERVPSSFLLGRRAVRSLRTHRHRHRPLGGAQASVAASFTNVDMPTALSLAFGSCDGGSRSSSSSSSSGSSRIHDTLTRTESSTSTSGYTCVAPTSGGPTASCRTTSSALIVSSTCSSARSSVRTVTE